MMQGAEEMVKSKWQLVMSCIEVYTSARNGADLPTVFHCMNRDKPKNVRQSITLSSEILTDTSCVNGL
jgi:hypothetical protein